MVQLHGIVTLTIWDLLQHKVWDEACEMKGLGDEFSFGPVFDNEYEFDFTIEEAKSLGISVG